jgi:hypothetical protein
VAPYVFALFGVLRNTFSCSSEQPCVGCSPEHWRVLFGTSRRNGSWFLFRTEMVEFHQVFSLLGGFFLARNGVQVDRHPRCQELSSQVKSGVTPQGNMKAARSVNHRGLPGGGQVARSVQEREADRAEGPRGEEGRTRRGKGTSLWAVAS